MAGVLLQFRPQYVLQDLSAAIVRTFREMHNKTAHERLSQREKICSVVEPMFEHWSVTQHSTALIDAIDEIFVDME